MMVRKVELVLTDEVAHLLEEALMGEEDFDEFARGLLLQGLSSYYQSVGDDESDKKKIRGLPG